MPLHRTSLRPRRRFVPGAPAREARLLDLLAAQMAVSRGLAERVESLQDGLRALLLECEAEERRLRADLATLQAQLDELVGGEVRA